MNYTTHHGNNLEILRTLADNSIDAIVTDPPYGLGKEPDALAMLRDWMTGDHHDVKGKGFMGKEWDAFVPQPALWKECLRVLKPGGHLLAFAGTRTQDLMALGLRIAGFEIRDMAAWLYGSGFPKSLDVSKAIDKAAGAEREVVGQRTTGIGTGNGSTPIMGDGNRDITAPATDAARQWQGWGTALKPALEPITVARKPLAGTVAENVQAHGTGALNIDGCRVGTEGGTTRSGQAPYAESGWRTGHKVETLNAGRWPANVLHDGSEEVVRLFPGEGDTSAARFFYCAKASKADRDEGLEGLEKRNTENWPQSLDGNDKRGAAPRANIHPTVKPTELMRYLCRLVTPPGGVVLDPFMGSGSTGKAAMQEGFRFIGIEREAEYVEIAQARIAAACVKVEDCEPDLFSKKVLSER